ncbi:MAG: Glycosyltransferases involved in cell wall biogenesis [Phormidesmis priestleyi Ana]|uniref:Glycosyltransferases involved in cell wall biogenesis n=1 Tax=Phormidesmis priestleyi Ana TaxID=1666911 RepID=A0A0P8BGY7_9CYAN|nr:MAG: Glycosyltransferases involved in cell wall biogenesis [Phormidesmis priestleyi Ana]
MLDQITPVLLTFNEEENIARTLSQLSWAARIVVVDSFSTDTTLEILSRYPNVEVYQRIFDTHAIQWNYALRQSYTTWVLSLDADYYLSDELIEEISQLTPTATAYSIKFKYCINGKPLRGAILPPRLSLFNRHEATYVDDGHTQQLKAEGTIQTLKHSILHDDRKSLKRWLWAQERYAILEVEKLNQMNPRELSMADRIRQYKVVAPLLVLFYCLFVRGVIFDGRAGWYYAWERTLAEIVLSLLLIEKQFKSPRKQPSVFNRDYQMSRS